MKGDFTRDTFDPALGFTRVLMQQGRVQLDADWNEQSAILTHYMRGLAKDLIGPFGGPRDALGFGIVSHDEDDTITIGKGVYYVDGIRCESVEDASFEDESLNDTDDFLIYLDVWERHVTYLEHPSIREVALLGPDTTTRAQLVAQVRCVNLKAILGQTIPASENSNEKLNITTDGITSQNAYPVLRFALHSPTPSSTPTMQAFTASSSTASTDPCLVSPDARYRGPENQLYRIEIHDAGPRRRPKDVSGKEGPGKEVIVANKPRTDARPGIPRGGERSRGVAAEDERRGTTATFKWSRENGSVVFPILKEATRTNEGTVVVTLAHLGRDPRFGLAVKDLVEWVDEEIVLSGRSGELLEVEAIDPASRTVRLRMMKDDVINLNERNRLLRRWDQKDNKKGSLRDGAIPIVEGREVTLEQGIVVKFGTSGATYRTGDYWLIPARTATGDVEWPNDKNHPDEPAFLPPRGVEHHYAPLALVSRSSGSWKVNDLRRVFDRLAVGV